MTRLEICRKASAAKIQKLKDTFRDRFWAKIRKGSDDECWEWLGSLNGCGYGQVKRINKPIMCHRLVWEFTFGPIPDGVLVLHKCDNRKCVNPSHLWLGGHKENAIDRERKNRGNHHYGENPERKGEKNAHSKLTDEIVKMIREMDFSKRGTKTTVARQLGIAHTNINHILHRRNWTHI